MTANTDVIIRIPDNSVFKLDTDALGQIMCGPIRVAVMLDKIFREQIEAGKLDSPTLVRSLLCHIARRIEGQQEGNDDGQMGARLSESDVSRLTESEVELFSEKSCVHHTWLLEVCKKSAADSSAKSKNVVSFKKNNAERYSDFLARALRVHIVEWDRQNEELIKRLRKTDLPLRHVGSSISTLQKNFDQIGQSFKAIDALRFQARKTLESFKGIGGQMHHSAFASTRMTEIFQANQHWTRMIGQATASSRVLPDLTHVHSTWLHNLKSAQNHAAALQLATDLSLGKMAYRLTVSERMFARVDISPVSRSIAFHENAILKLRALGNDFTTTYRRLTESISTYQDITRLPKSILPNATRELYVTNFSIDALRVYDEHEAERDSSEIHTNEEIIEEISHCPALLKAVDPKLVTMYVGARNAVHGNNLDKRRHVLISLRELVSHLLRRLAPDENVRAWIPEGNTTWLYNGKPTRTARLRYLCREIEHEPMNEFIDSDTRAMIQLIKILNRVHEPEIVLSNQQLRALLHRTESFITFIVQIWMESRYTM